VNLSARATERCHAFYSKSNLTLKLGILSLAAPKNNHLLSSVALMSLGSRPRFLSRRKHVAEGRQEFVASVFPSLHGSSSIWGPISAILLQLGIVALLLVVLKTEIFVDSWATSSSNSIHLVYITLLTVLATIITSFTTGSIQKLWFYRSAFLSSDSSLSTETSIKVLAGLGAVIDQLKGWQVSLTFVFAGLIRPPSLLG